MTNRSQLVMFCWVIVDKEIAGAFLSKYNLLTIQSASLKCNGIPKYFFDYHLVMQYKNLQIMPLKIEKTINITLPFIASSLLFLFWRLHFSFNILDKKILHFINSYWVPKKIFIITWKQFLAVFNKDSYMIISQRTI